MVNSYTNESRPVENTGSDIEISIPEDLKWAKAVLKIESGSDIYTVPFPLNPIVTYNKGSVGAGESFVINLNIPEKANSTITYVNIIDTTDSSSKLKIIGDKPSLDNEGRYTSNEIVLSDEVLKYGTPGLRIRLSSPTKDYYVPLSMLKILFRNLI